MPQAKNTPNISLFYILQQIFFQFLRNIRTGRKFIVILPFAGFFKAVRPRTNATTCLQFSEKYLYAGTEGASVWMLNLSALGINATDRLAKWRPAISDNRMEVRIVPGGKLTVEFSREVSPRRVTSLHLRDAMGRKVIQADPDCLKSGQVMHKWDTSELGSGFYVLEATLENGKRLSRQVTFPK